MMAFQPVVLWTDMLLFGLLASIVVAIAGTQRSEPLQRAWRRVGESDAGMASLTILSMFLLVGMVDSLHYRARLESVPEVAGKTVLSSEVRSFLDVLAEPLRSRVEKTYSAPLAYRLYTKETVEGEDGVQRREMPRLKFGGSGLQYPEDDHVGDVLGRIGIGLAIAAASWGVLALVLAKCVALSRQVPLGAAWRAIWRGRGGLAWRSVLSATGGVCIFVGPLIALAAEYHVLGTDKVGQDVLYLALKSIRTALVIGTLTTLVTLPLAVLLGIVA